MLENESRANGVKTGRLNSFQRTMLEWNDTHPYNAVHVARVPAPLDLERLRKILDRTMESRGLTGLTLDRDQGTYRYRGGPAQCDIRTIAGEESGRSALIAEIESQLNTAFIPGERFMPFRCFVAPQAGCFSLGLTYFHAVADAESFVFLVKEIVETYLGRNEDASAAPADLYPPCYDNLLRRQPALLARKLSAIPALVRDMRTSCRPPYRNGLPTTNGFTLCTLGAGDFQHLIAAAKSWGVTLND